MAAPGLLALPLLLSALQFVESNVACPRPEAVEARVRSILGIAAQQPLDEHASVVREGGRLLVSARGADGQLIGERTLAAGGSCEELEVVVSVVLASWLSDIHPEFVGVLPAAPPEPLPPPPAAVRAPRQPMQTSIGAGLGAAISAGHVTLLGSLGARWMPRRSGLGVAAAAMLIAPRDEPLSTGKVRYFRWPLVLGPAWRTPLGPALLELHAGAALAWLHLEGEGFDASLSRDAARLGGLLDARLMHGGALLKAFIDVSGIAWGRTEAFVVGGTEQHTLPLPSFELYASVGAAWSL